MQPKKNNYLKHWVPAHFEGVVAFAEAMEITRAEARQLLRDESKIDLEVLKKLNALGYPLERVMEIEKQITNDERNVK